MSKGTKIGTIGMIPSEVVGTAGGATGPGAGAASGRGTLPNVGGTDSFAQRGQTITSARPITFWIGTGP